MTPQLNKPKFSVNILMVCLSGVLLILTFRGIEMHYIAWIALVPLFLLIMHSGLLRAILSSLLLGLIFFYGILWWTLKIDGIGIYNSILIALGLSFYWGIFGLLANYFHKKIPRWNTLTFPTTWVLLEYIRSHLAFLSFPWGILGYSQYTSLSVARISTFTGVYGVSFLIVTINTVLTEIIHSYFPSFKLKVFGEVPPSSKRKSPFVILAVVLILFSAFYGVLSSTEKVRLPNLKVAIVQGNVYSNEKDNSHFRDFRDRVFQKYHRLTLNAADSMPNLIVWPSSSVPGNIPYDRGLVALLASLAQKTETFLLIGSAGFDKFNEEQRKSRRIANSAFLFSPQGNIIGRYDKIWLLPFDEYIPLRGYVKWPSWIVSPDITDHYPGKEMTIFRTDKAKFGVQICWENMFPDLFRKMVVQGVDFMVSMTNEGFTDIPAAHHQMLAINVFRAIENHVSIVRTASTGVSCIIDPNGHIIAKVQDQNLNDVNIEGYTVAQILLSTKRTFYSRYGDWFVYILFVILIGFILRIIISRHHPAGETEG